MPEGYVLRAPRLEEAAAVSDLLNTLEIAISGKPDSSEEKVRWNWSGPNIVLNDDLRVAVSPEGQVVGYLEYEAFEPWTQLFADGYVHPEHVGLGIGTTLTDWGEQRALQDAGRVPLEEKVVLRHFLWVHDQRSRDFLETRGWQICRWFYHMLIELEEPISEPAAIEGIEIRIMRPGEERAVWAADDEAFRDHWGYVAEPYDEWHHRAMGNDDYDPELVFVAMDGDEVAGCALNYPRREEDPEKGWTQFLGVRKPWRRRGIALALLQTSLVALQRRGCARVGLGVDAENPNGAVALYEKAGMHVEREAVSYEKAIREPTAR